MMCTSVLILAALALIVGLWVVWWRLPIHVSRRRSIIDNASAVATLEDNTRKTIAQAIAGVAALSGIYLAIHRYALNNDTQQLEQFTKGYAALSDNGGGETTATHIGGVFALQSLNERQPAWNRFTLPVISAAAVQFSRNPTFTTVKEVRLERITPDAQVAIGVVAHMQMPHSGDGWRVGHDLAGGKYNGARLPSAEFADANFENSDLTGADLYHSNFFNANLVSAKLNGANMPSWTKHRWM